MIFVSSLHVNPKYPISMSTSLISLSPDALQLAALLTALTQPNTEAIRQAEALLKPILKDARSVSPLAEVLAAREMQPDAVRHVAGVLLRKRLSAHYTELTLEFRNAFKERLLAIMSSEPNRSVRNAAVGVAAALCKADAALQETERTNNAAVSGGGGVAGSVMPWPQLFIFLSVASQDTNVDARELAYLLLVELTDTVASYLTPQFPSMAQLFHHTMASPVESNKVKIACIKALGALLSYLSDEDTAIQPFVALVPQLLSVSQQLQKKGGEDEVISTVLDVLYDLAFCPSPSVTTHLQDIVLFALGCLTDTNLEMNVRDSSSLVIAAFAESKAKSFGKNQPLIETLLDAIFTIIENSKESAAGALFASNPAWKDDFDDPHNAKRGDDDDDEDHDDDEDSPNDVSIAQGTLDMLACEISSKFIFQPIMTRVLMRLASVHAHHRKAAMACLGVAVEGCAEPITNHLNDILPHVLRACGDSDSQVRECASFSLGQLSEHCQPDILDHSSQILPIVFALLDDPTTAVQVTSLYVLEMFCERLDPASVRPYLDSLIRKLCHILETTSKRSLQEMAISAIAATAVAAEEEFTKYMSPVADLIGRLMTIQDEKLHSLRGRAIECMGHMAIAVGRDNFRPYFADTMKCACEGLTFDNTELHEYAYALFCNLAKVMESEFSPCLGELVPHLIAVINQDESAFESVEKENEEPGISSLEEDSDGEDDEGDGKYVFNVRTALIDSKKGAISAIGEIASYCGPAFMPFLEEAMKALQSASNHWHPSMKFVVAESLPSLVIASVAANHHGKIPWVKGDISGLIPLCSHTNDVTLAALSILVPLMKDEDEGTVGKACEGIQTIIELCGPHALAMVANDCLGNTLSLLKKVAPCQGSVEVENEGVDDEIDDDHMSFMSSVCDLIGAFAKVMGALLVPYLNTFLQPLVNNFMKSSCPTDDRSMAIGCLGEIAQELGNGMIDHWTSIFLPAIETGLADEGMHVKRNAAFCAGVCCESLGETITMYYPKLLQALRPLFFVDDTNSDSSAAKDNAAAAVARMIIASPNSVPLVHVLGPFLKALPLKSDTSENEVVYNCLLGLISMKRPELQSHGSDIQRIILEVINNDDHDVNEDLRNKMRLVMSSLSYT